MQPLIRLLFIILLPATLARAADIHLLYRGIQPTTLPATASDQHGKDFKITGMSGIAYDGSEFCAVLDNSNKLVRFQITFKDDCSIRKVKVVAGLSLSERHDYEGVAIDPGNRSIGYVSEEDTPAVYRIDLTTGQLTSQLQLPRVFAKVQRNQGLESLTMSPDGTTLWTANERALPIDGNLKAPAEPFGSTTRVRLQRFDVSGERPYPTGQFVYQTSGVHQLGGQIGLCDLVALADGRLLALERSAAQAIAGDRSIRTRIFLIDTTGATDVSGLTEGLKDKTYTKVRKTLLYDGFIFDHDGENLEGLCLGPQVQPNRYIVLGVVDDGDGIRASKPRIVAFELLLPRNN
jgi:hypothetical protein